MTTPSPELSPLEKKVRSFLQGEAVLADLYGMTTQELYEIAQQGQKFFEQGQLAKAQKIFEGLTALDPYDGNFHTGLGAVFQKTGARDRAIVEYDRAVSLNQLDVAARTNRAEVLIELGEFDKAVADLTEVARIDPEAKQPHTKRAKALAMALANAARPKA